MTLRVATESPVSDSGRSLIAGSQAALMAVCEPDEIFTMTAEELDSPHITFHVARIDGIALGCGASVDYGDYAEVKRLFVASEARGKGIAQAIMDVIETNARVAAKIWVRLETTPVLTAAIALYAGRGYVERGPFGNYPPHPASLFMEKRL